MYDLAIVDKSNLGDDVIDTYFLDPAAAIRRQLRDCATMRDLAWKTFNSLLKQFALIYFVYDTYQQQNIKTRGKT